MKYAITLSLFAVLSGQSVVADVPLSAVRSADIVFLGEVHDNPDHHREQAVLTELIKPSAIVFEMLTPEKAELVTDGVRSDPDTLAEAVDWASSGWPDFAMYYPIFAAAPTASIYGAMVPRKETQSVFEDGPATVFGDQAATFGLDGPLPADQQTAREALQDAAHCGALPPEMLGGMVDVQRLRDALLARVALEAFRETEGPIVVITGNGHARHDWGAPSYVRRVAPDVRLISIGQGEEGRPPEGGFDMVKDAPAPERDDPCAAFQ